MASDHSFRFIVLEAEFKTGIGGEKYSCKVFQYCIELNVSMPLFHSSTHQSMRYLLPFLNDREIFSIEENSFLRLR